MTTTTTAQGRDTFDLYHTNMFEVGAGLVKPYVGNGARPTAVSVHVRAASPESRRNRDIYAGVGVPEFWRYSEAAGPEAFTLVDGGGVWPMRGAPVFSWTANSLASGTDYVVSVYREATTTALKQTVVQIER